jgi:hypothetical protein
MVAAGTGWAIGVVWFSVLSYCFGPSGTVTSDGEVVTEVVITPTARLRYAPLFAIPWGVVGLIVGLIIGRKRGGGAKSVLLVLSGAGIGLTLAAIEYPFDGWLFLTMPVYAFVGAGVGLVASEIVASLRGPQCESGQSVK